MSVEPEYRPPRNSQHEAEPGPPKRRFSWGGVTFQLFVILILPLTALLLGITFWSINIHQHAMRDLVGERDERVVKTTAASLQAQLQLRAVAIQNLAAQASAWDRNSLDSLLTQATPLLTLFEGGVAFFTPQGDFLAGNGDPTFWENTADSSLDSFLQASSNPETLTPTFITPPSSQAVAFVRALGMREEGQEIIAVGAFSPAALARQTLAEAFPPNQEMGIILVDQNQTLLYASGSFSEEGNPVNHAGVKEALEGESGAAYFPVEGTGHVVAYTAVNPMGWALVVEEPWEMVAGPLLSYTQMAPLVLVPMLLLMLLALWFGVRQIVQPLQALEAQAVALAWGDYAAVEQPVGGIAEIQRVQGGLIYLAQKVRAAQQSLHGYIGAITAGQEEERRRLARDLHDDTLQSLIALKQRVQWAQLKASEPAVEESLPASLTVLEDLTEKTIHNLRRLTRALRPIYLEDLGLPAALEMLAQEVSQASNLPIEYHRYGTEKRLPAEVELALYRMAQEALNNGVRHAQAKTAKLVIDYTAEKVKLEVSDDGQGFEPPKSPAEYASTGHFGLLGLRERSELIGAQLEIRSAPGQGTLVRVTLLSPHPDQELE